MDLTDVQFRLAAARRMLLREGCDSGVLGVLSVRIQGEDAVWATAMEPAEHTAAVTILKVSPTMDVLQGSGRISPAILTHFALYAGRPDVHAVVHTHSHAAAVVSATGRPIGMYNEMSTMYHEEQACFEDDGEQSPAAAARAARALGDRRVLLLKGHGVVIAAASLEDAAIDAIAVEKSARWHLDSQHIGGKEIVLPHILQTRPLYDQYFRRNMWAANLRRLRRSDPDLFDGVSVA